MARPQVPATASPYYGAGNLRAVTTVPRGGVVSGSLTHFALVTVDAETLAAIDLGGRDEPNLRVVDLIVLDDDRSGSTCSPSSRCRGPRGVRPSVLTKSPATGVR
ncbi:MAG: hypothetical protein ACJ74R_11360 [Gaiellaceae bacterium]